MRPTIPARWPVPAATSRRIDYAQGRAADAWLRHPILGDPSFDSFVRRPGNPIVRGEAPFQWPVNGFLFEDPVSGHWFAYVGRYLEGYDLGPGKPITHCQILRSDDRGGHWRVIGKLFDDGAFTFDGDRFPASIAPDVSVVFHDGRYHMAYDWATDNTTWQNASSPGGGADSGVGYAWAEQPGGPWRRAPTPILRASELQRRLGSATRYRRPYATTLIRRKRDWLVLVDADSGGHFAWGQYALTAADPLGPWSAPTLVTSLEGETYFPAPIESFPAFAHDGYVYDPKTSVGANRNFQVIHRARIEDAHRADAWELFQHGSVWHAEPVADEGFGIWGQTLAGFVDRAGDFQVLFPSRRWPGGAGTIHLASRPWKQPLRTRGFVLSAHSAASVTATRTAYGAFRLDAAFAARGTVRLAFGGELLLGAEGRADGKPHARTLTGYDGALEITGTACRLVDGAGKVRAESAGATANVQLTRTDDGRVTAALDGGRTLSAELPASAGPLRLVLEPGSHLSVERFTVTGTPATALWGHLFTEAIAGAGVAEGDYQTLAGPLWRHGIGADCTRPGERVKWNFRGDGFRLWLPSGPRWGKVRVALDGKPLGEIDLHAPSERPSTVVLERMGLGDGFRALTVVSLGGPMPVDCLDALQ